MYSFSRMCGWTGFSTPGRTPNVDRYTPQPLPAQTASVEVKGGEVQRFVQDMDIPGQWWTLFHSKPLNDLIAQALKANPDTGGGASRIARCLGKRLCTAGRFLSQRRSQFQSNTSTDVQRVNQSACQRQ